MYISIRTKILGVLSALLVAAIFAYLVLADRIFREDKQLLVFDTNRSNAERLSADMDIAIRRVLDKSETLARLVLNDRSPGAKELARDFFKRDGELVAYQIISYDKNAAGPGMAPGHVVRELVDDAHLARRHLTRASLLALSEGQPAAPPSAGDANRFEQVSIENVSQPGAIVYLVQVPIEVAGETSRHLLVRAFIDGQDWLSAFENQNLSLSFAISRSGLLLAHPDARLVATRKDMGLHDLVRLARQNRMPGRQVEFDWNGDSYLGVYQRGNVGGFTVFSMISKKLALSASLLLLEKTIVLSAIVITLVLLVGMWFARSLSRPLRQLVAAAGEIAKGRFDTHIRAESHDEIGELARAFDHMARDLKSSRVQLEDYSRSLEAKVQERTRELESKNAAIKDQQETLVRTTRLAAVGEIAGQAAHEVLNPLTGMIARLEGMRRRSREYFTDEGGAGTVLSLIADGWQKTKQNGGVPALLAELESPSKAHRGKTLIEEDLSNLVGARERLAVFARQLADDLDLLHSESFRISRIVDSMRGLSRHTQIKARTDLAELIVETVRVSEDFLAQNRIVIETQLGSDLFASVDRDELRQVFANLVRNGRDAIIERRQLEAGAGKIMIGGRRTGKTVTITFRDNGIGLAESDRVKIFESNFSTKGSAGTGFGLGICRRFVRAAGGEIQVVASEPGSFTEFEITLPYATEAAREAQG